jgi:ABC-type lipoprotein export system ATPase subunit
VTGPSVILADEPTGNLDAQTGVEIVDVLRELNADGATILVVTHDPQIAARCGRTIRFEDGRVADGDVVSRSAE